MVLFGRKKWLIAFFILFAGPPIYGQGLPKLKSYDAESLPGSRQFWAIEQDTSGILFFGNSAGLAKFDGSRWDFLHPPVNYVVRALHRATDGTMYYGSEADFGVIVPDSLGRFTVQSWLHRLPETTVNLGEIWDIREYEGRIYFQADNHIIWTEGDSVNLLESETRLRRLEVVDDQLITFKHQTGLVRITDKGFIPAEKGEIFAEDMPYLVENIAGETGFFSRQKGVTLWDGTSYRSASSALSDSVITYLPYRSARSAQQKLALATLSGGIMIMNPDSAFITDRISVEDGLNTNIVYDVFYDAEHTLWAALDDGLVQVFTNYPERSIDERSGFKGIVTGVVPFHQNVYIGSTEGLFATGLKGNRVEKVYPDNDLFFSRIIDMVSYKKTVYLSTPEGIFEMDENQNFRSVNAFESGVFKVADDQRLYLISTQEVFKFNEKEKSFERFTEHPPASITDFEVYENRHWLLDENEGVFMLHHPKTDTVMQFNGEMKGEFLKVIWGELWLGTSRGLFKFNREKGVFDQSYAFSDSDIRNYQVSVFSSCGNEELWLRANRQIKKLLVRDGQWELQETPYQQIGYQESIYEIACMPQQVWFGGSEGIYILNKEDYYESVSYKTNINGLYIRRDSLIYGGYGKAPRDIILPYKDNELRFSYAASSYLDTERSQFQVMLDGFDENWSRWTSETQKDYTNIPEGRYTFRVRSKNVFGVYGQEDSVPFEILPPWYRTYWAYFIYICCIVGILYTAYKIRVNQLLRVQRIRNRIASDLHDEVSATLSSISYFAQAIQRDDLQTDKNRFVNLIAKSAGDAKEKITDIVWAINPEHDEWKSFLAKCRRFASDLLESKNINYSLKITDDIPGKLDMDMRQHLWLIFKEMITNAVRHSGATQLDVILTYQHNQLKLVVQDNGTGMDIDRVKKGNGLINIQKRVELISGTLRLKSEKDFGTRWMLKVPL